MKFDGSFTRQDVIKIFHDNDADCNGTLDFDEFAKIVKDPQATAAFPLLNESHRPSTGPILDVLPTKERYFGENILNMYKEGGVDEFVLSTTQQMAMELYESRIASMQRFVSMTVMFHQMGHRVQAFFPAISFGLLGYRIDHTHSIMRIATTASPVSGADVRRRMVTMNLRASVEKAVGTVGRAYRRYRRRTIEQALSQRNLFKTN